MQVQITKSSVTQYEHLGRCVIVEAVCGKVSGVVCMDDYGVRVICENAAHRCWRGMGKHFRTADEAIANYRSGEMKAIIAAALDFALEAA